jgi:hypothetical protein
VFNLLVLAQAVLRALQTSTNPAGTSSFQDHLKGSPPGMFARSKRPERQRCCRLWMGAMT